MRDVTILSRYLGRTARIYLSIYVSLVVGSIVFAVAFSQAEASIETVAVKSTLRVGFYVAILFGLHRVWTRFAAGLTFERDD